MTFNNIHVITLKLKVIKLLNQASLFQKLNAICLFYISELYKQTDLPY